MNNNRQPNNNNRRRGRSNNNNGGSRPQSNNNNRNGFDNLNRIDNRARGNASQMLEKYKKLAADAQHNDDRVNAEYYLQFADHYFRVLADSKSRQEERQEERRPQRDEAREERYNSRDDSEENGEAAETVDVAETDNDDRDARPARTQENRPQESRQQENRPPRKERTARPPRRHHSEEAADEVSSGLDVSILPPAISVAPNDSEDNDSENDAKPARKLRARRVKPASEDSIAAAAE